MDQKIIWNHFQNEKNDDIFEAARPRYRFIARHIPPSANALNIGVGRGGLESILAAKGVGVSCLDPNMETIETVKRSLNLGERAKVGFSYDIPFPDGQFDVVIMTEVLEHLDKDVLKTTLSEIRRVLKPGGRFIGTVPANEILSDSEVICPHCRKIFHRWGHVQSFSPKTLRDILSASGMTVQRLETRGFPDWRRGGLRNFIKCLVKYLLCRAGVSILQPNIFFMARRRS